MKSVGERLGSVFAIVATLNEPSPKIKTIFVLLYLGSVRELQSHSVFDLFVFFLTKILVHFTDIRSVFIQLNIVRISRCKM